MTRAEMRRRLSGDEYTGWVALHNARAKEEKAAQAKNKRRRR